MGMPEGRVKLLLKAAKMNSVTVITLVLGNSDAGKYVNFEIAVLKHTELRICTHYFNEIYTNYIKSRSLPEVLQ